MSRCASSSLSYANVMATVAVFIAIGGSATAAALITGNNVKNGSLTGADVKKGSLTTREIKNGTILSQDLKPGLSGSHAKGVNIGDDQPMTVQPDGVWKTIARVHTSTKSSGGLFVFTGGVEETSASKTTPATVELRLVHNAHVHPLASRNTIGIADSGIGLVSFLCNESPGAQDFELQVHTTGAPIAIGRRTLAISEQRRLP
jgi:hypothetical protein